MQKTKWEMQKQGVIREFDLYFLSATAEFSQNS
jgi:hypothetical protein